MRKLLISSAAMALSLVLISICYGQSGGDIITESSAANFFGVGARAVGMSEAVVVSSMDGSAIVYNPAGLVRIMRPEFLAGLSNEHVSNTTSSLIGTGNASDKFSKTRLNSLNLSVPVPTYRGALVVAFGVNRTKSFDRTFTYDQVTSTGSSNADESADGGIREWSAAGAMELSSRLSVGLTLIYYRGSEDYFWDYASHDDYGATANNDHIQSDYSAIGARVGSIWDVSPHLSFGLTIDAPTQFRVKQDYTQHTKEPAQGTNPAVDETVAGNYQYDLRHPFIFTGGMAIRISDLLVEGDLGYADWSQLEYKNAPELDTRALRHAYTDALQYRIGAEYVVARYGFVLRGGYKHDPLPYSGFELNNQVEKDRNSFSLGVGFLIDRIAMLDIGYARANYTLLDAVSNLSQKYTSDRLLFTIGYRI